VVGKRSPFGSIAVQGRFFELFFIIPSQLVLGNLNFFEFTGVMLIKTGSIWKKLSAALPRLNWHMADTPKCKTAQKSSISSGVRLEQRQAKGQWKDTEGAL
jgi:hypothetical protein